MDAKVLSCGVNSCAYNISKGCHASSIQVGSNHAMCDTFTMNATPNEAMMPAVTSCDVSECKFNTSLNCQAPGITVWGHEQHADCATFLPQS